MTDNIKALVERLRELCDIAGVRLPTMLEAADLIEQQAARIAELERTAEYNFKLCQDLGESIVDDPKTGV